MSALTFVTQASPLLSNPPARLPGNNEEWSDHLGPRRAIHVMGFAEIDSASWSGSGVIPAIEMAVEDVNSRPDILPGYELNVIMKDSKVRHLAD